MKTSVQHLAQWAAWPLVLVAALAGCGRPATETECREILRRAAQLELKERLSGSTELIEAEVRALEESMRPTMMNQCVGKRVTHAALTCVRKAKTSEQLQRECFD